MNSSENQNPPALEDADNGQSGDEMDGTGVDGNKLSDEHTGEDDQMNGEEDALSGDALHAPASESGDDPSCYPAQTAVSEVRKVIHRVDA